MSKRRMRRGRKVARSPEKNQRLPTESPSNGSEANRTVTRRVHDSNVEESDCELLNPVNEEGIWPYLFLLAICILSPCVVYEYFLDNVNLPKSLFLQNACLLLLMVWIWTSQKSGCLRLVTNRAHYVVLFLLVWSAVTLLWAVNRYEGVLLWATWAAQGILFFLATQILWRRSRILFLARTMAAVSVPIAILGLLQLWFGVHWIRFEIPPAATFGNKNPAAHYIVLSIPLFLVCLATARSRWTLFLWACGLSTLLVFLISSLTRAAWLAFAVQLLVSLILVLHRVYFSKCVLPHFRSIAAASVASALSAVIIVSSTPGDGGGSISEGWDRVTEVADAMAPKESVTEESRSEGPGSSVQIRLTLWRNTLHMLKDHMFFGVGIYNWKEHYPITQSRQIRDRTVNTARHPLTPHNEYLQLAAELGLPFLIACIGMFALLGGYCLQAILHTEDPIDWILGTSSILVIAGISVIACFSFPISRAIPPLQLAIAVAILIRTGSSTDNVEFNSITGRQITFFIRRSHRLKLFGLAVITLWAGATYFHYRIVRGEYNRSKMVAAHHLKLYDAVIHWGERSLQFNPWNHEPLVALAEAYQKLGEARMASRVFDEVVRRFPYSPFYIYRHALYLRKEGLLEEARKRLEYLNEIIPDDDEVLGALGRVHWDMGENDAALAYFRSAVEIDPKNSLHRFNLGAQQYLQRDYRTAESTLRDATKLDPANTKALELLGITLYYHTERKGEGIEFMRNALQHESKLENRELLLKSIAEWNVENQKD